MYKCLIVRCCMLAILYSGLSLSVWGASNTGKEKYFVKNGKSKYNIVIPDESLPGEELAGRQISHYIQKSTGALLPVIKENQAKNTGNIYIGNCHKTNKSGVTLAGLKNDGFILKKIGSDLFIRGRDSKHDPLKLNKRYIKDGSKDIARLGAKYGTLFGAFEFLERVIGVRWYVPGEFGECVPKHSNIKLQNFNEKQNPAYTQRYWWPSLLYDFSIEDTRMWELHMRFGGESCIPNHSHLYWGKRFGKKHPEYFLTLKNGMKVIKGKNFPYSHLDYNNPKVLSEEIKIIDNVYKKNGYSYPPYTDKYIYVVPNDTYALSLEKTELYKKLGLQKLPYRERFSDLWFSYISKVAKICKQKYPGKIIATLAYNMQTMPPKNVAIPDNVSVKIVLRPCTPSWNIAAFYDFNKNLIDEWLKKCKNVGIWINYITWGKYPAYTPHIIHDFYKRYNGKVSHVFIETQNLIGATPNSPKIRKDYIDNGRNTEVNMGITFFNLFLTMKSLWNPDYDLDKEMETFYKGFFGPAANDMKKYFTLAINTWENPKNVKIKDPQKLLRNNYNIKLVGSVIYKEIFTPDIVKELAMHIDNALKKTSPKSIYAKRIMWLKTNYFDYFKNKSDNFGSRFRKPDAVSYKLEKAPVIDGILDEQCWKKLKPYNIQNTLKMAVASNKSTFYVRNDDENLYIAIKANDRNINTMMRSCKPSTKDSPVWNDDGFELFFQFPGIIKDKRYYHIIVNTIGASFDRELIDGKSDTDWTCKGLVSKSVINKKDKFYTMEIKVPLKSFGINKVPEGKWINFNICRNKRSGGAVETIELSSWAPSFGKFNDPKTFGRLLFADKNSFTYIPQKSNMPRTSFFNFSSKEAKKATPRLNRVNCTMSSNKLEVAVKFPVNPTPTRVNLAGITWNLPKGIKFTKKTMFEICYESTNNKMSFVVTWKYRGADKKIYHARKMIYHPSEIGKSEERSFRLNFFKDGIYKNKTQQEALPGEIMSLSVKTHMNPDSEKQMKYKIQHWSIIN